MTYADDGETFVAEFMALSHHGVKGMHWGVRKERTIATRSDRVAAVKNFNVELRKLQMNRVQIHAETLRKGNAGQLNKKDVLIKAGTPLYRVSRQPNEDPRSVKYVSLDKQDHVNYKAIGSTYNLAPGHKRYPDLYENTYRVTKMLKAPSEQKRYDAVMDLMTKPSIVTSSGHVVTGRTYMESLGVGRGLSSVDDKTYAQMTYPVVLAAMGNGNLKIGNAYSAKFAAQGYNSIFDDNDRLVTSAHPLILTNPAGTIIKTSTRKLSNSEITEAQKNFRTPAIT